MAVGHSTLPDSHEAGREAAATALAGGADPKLLLVFASGRHNLATLLRAIGDQVGDVPVVGCSAAGEISREGPSVGSIVVTAFGGPGFSVSATMTQDASSDPRAAGARIATCLADVETKPYRVLMLLVDGTDQHQEEIVRGVYGAVGASVPLVGACAGEETWNRATTQFYGTQVLRDAAIAAAIGSDAPLGIGMSHGWRIAGDAMVVTGARKGWITTLDDRPALDTYLERVDAPQAAYHDPSVFAPFATVRPLGIRGRSGDAVRGFAGIPDFDGRRLCCGGEITQGTLIWCMEGDRATMLDATDAACRQALEAIDTRPLGLVAFDCSGRRSVLGDEGAGEEVRRLNSFAAGSSLAGFYSFGEIARTRGINGFHHQTLVVLAVA
jgi:hypothetical protein